MCFPVDPRYNVQTKLLEGKPSNLNLVNLTLLITGTLRVWGFGFRAHSSG